MDAGRRQDDPSAASPGASDPRSTGELLASLVVNLQALLAKEVELFGLELRGLVGRKLAGLGLLLTAALASTGVLMLGAITLGFVLEGSFETRWHAWGVATLIFLVVTLILVGLTARFLGGAWTPTRTGHQLGETKAWLGRLTSTPATDPDHGARP
jgi:hypothetical protein